MMYRPILVSVVHFSTASSVTNNINFFTQFMLNNNTRITKIINYCRAALSASTKATEREFPEILMC